MKALAVIAIVLSVFIFPRLAPAQTWTQTGMTNTSFWRSISCSADGSRLVALSGSIPYAQGIYTSADSGATWTSNNVPAVEWWSVASSADGTKLIAAASYSGSGIFTSTNSGATWVSNSVPGSGWFSVASSADGTKLVAVAGGGQALGPICTTTNSGGNWTSNQVPPNYWMSVASSADGARLVALAVNNYYTSTNSGSTWVSNGIPSVTWGSVASSADGTKLVAAVIASGTHFLLTSTNSGASWITNTAPISRVESVAASSDGVNLMAVEESRIWVTTNSGTTWFSNNLSGFWSGAAMSADARKLYASADLVGIWTLQTPPSLQLNLALSSNNLNLSWLIPSTNMVLQESPDLMNWTTLTNVPSLNDTNLQEQVTLPSDGGDGFFRLVSQ